MNRIIAFAFLFAVACGAFAASPSLTYTATLGHVSGGNVITKSDLTTNVEMTVALYASKDATAPLWCRRLAATVESGCFAVVLTDENTVDVSASELASPARFATLAALFRDTDATAETWVEIANVTADGKALADVSSPLPRGKWTAAPFALVAESAVSSRSSFRVRGTATIACLETLGDVAVEGNAEFKDAVTFNRMATFGDGGLVVTGLLSKATLDDIGTLSASNLVASQAIDVKALTITDGNATTFTSVLSGFKPPESLSVGGILTVGATLDASDIVADDVEVTGDFTLPSDGVLDWAQDGTLTVPDGVYAAHTDNFDIYTTSTHSYENATGRDALLTYAVGDAADGAYVGKINGSTWVTYGTSNNGSASVGVDVTTLFPLRPNDSASATMVLTRSVKELSK